ncbi:MAG: hypothetical protein AM326_11770 [Candidatus Thorarchaeota archaeon SMTZ-45]|nr:MAG: hypothetical protein AM326_11770 [Candidatus Thorarchaeota archaeon SMTZ-45]KXH74978.1 MAG: hypothetical protein AM325_11630 [Candidatus Thorarchaeota archaeon SMTZ1-45]
MIIEWVDEDRSQLRSLFESHKRARALIFPALDQGRGNIWTNSTEAPTVARLQLVVINAVAGDSTSPDAVELIRMIEPMQLVFGPDDKWTRIIKNLWGERLGIQKRALLSPDTLNLDHLKHLLNQLPKDYKLKRMELEAIKRLDKRNSMHIPTFFGSSESFHKMGIAYGIYYGSKLVCMASTFMPFTNEFEIQVDTFDLEHRRKGLATVASAALLIHALENGIVPQWDAANEASINLALKLGYINPDPWEAYYLKPIR